MKSNFGVIVLVIVILLVVIPQAIWVIKTFKFAQREHQMVFWILFLISAGILILFSILFLISFFFFMFVGFPPVGIN